MSCHQMPVMCNHAMRKAPAKMQIFAEDRQPTTMHAVISFGRPMWRLSWWSATSCWAQPEQRSGCCTVRGTRASPPGCLATTRCIAGVVVALSNFHRWAEGCSCPP